MVDFLKDYDYKNIGDKVVYPSDLISDSIVHRSKKNCDLVIMGTKGERNAMDKFLGSVTTNTMMNAGCPVLAIPEDATFEGIKQIAYATSLENKDQLFLEQLASFAKTVGATIDLLHVSKEPTAKAQVLEMEKEFASEFARIHIVDNPSIMEGVDEFLKESHADVLALFIPKRNLWNRLFHKSFSKKMTFHAAIPLFVFHE
jgi:nucleotide-binding universal stress UspA family protein